MKTQVHTLSKDEAKRLDGPNAKRNALPVKGNLSSAFISISLISAGSFTDTKSWVGPNHSLTTDPYFLCETDKTSESQRTSNIKTFMKEHTPKKKVQTNSKILLYKKHVIMRLKKMDFIINSNDLHIDLLSNDKDYNIKQRKQPKVHPKSKSLL